MFFVSSSGTMTEVPGQVLAWHYSNSDLWYMADEVCLWKMDANITGQFYKTADQLSVDFHFMNEDHTRIVGDQYDIYCLHSFSEAWR